MFFANLILVKTHWQKLQNLPSLLPVKKAAQGSCAALRPDCIACDKSVGSHVCDWCESVLSSWFLWSYVIFRVLERKWKGKQWLSCPQWLTSWRKGTYSQYCASGKVVIGWSENGGYLGWVWCYRRSLKIQFLPFKRLFFFFFVFFFSFAYSDVFSKRSYLTLQISSWF